MGFGEEISWGQRIINYDTPKFMQEKNLQNEFTIHNLETFNAYNSEKELKKGFNKLLSISFLYKLFWLTLGILIPLLANSSMYLRNYLIKNNIPIAPITLGLCFMLNWAIYKLSGYYLKEFYEYTPQMDRLDEIYEFSSACIFVFLFVIHARITLHGKKLQLFTLNEHN